jgi:hypothetical protein
MTTLSDWIDYLLIVNSDMSKESSKRFINSWLTEELMLRGFKQDDIDTEFVNRGWYKRRVMKCHSKNNTNVQGK